MVRVGEKPETHRRAIAEATLHCQTETAKRIAAADLPKGDALATARVAGVMAAKRTPDLIPLCHPLPLTGVEVDLDVDGDTIRIRATVETVARTGVEMEALTAVTVAALTVYDMAKGIDKWMTITDVSLIEKTGGKSGDWVRESSPGVNSGGESR